MLQEIATIGTAMTLAIVVAWIAMVAIANAVEKSRGKNVQIAAM
jgi:hypothetical protein